MTPRQQLEALATGWESYAKHCREEQARAARFDLDTLGAHYGQMAELHESCAQQLREVLAQMEPDEVTP